MFIFIPLTFTPLLIKAITHFPTIQEVPGPLYPLFVLYFLSWLYYGLTKMHHTYKTSEGFKKNQIKFFFLSLIIAFTAAINFFICMFNPKFPPFYYVIQAIYSICVGYAVIRYRLMDFDLLVRWGLAYGAITALSGIIFAGTIYLTGLVFKGGIPGLPYWIGSFTFILTFDPLRKRTIAFVDRYIFQSPDFKQILGELTQTLQTPVELNILAIKMCDKMKEIWKVEHAGLVLWDQHTSRFMPFPHEAFEKIGLTEADISLPHSDFLIRTLESERRLFQYGIVLDEEVEVFGNRSSAGERATFAKIHQTMKRLGAAACVPITLGDQLMGFIVLGPKKSGALYNREDKKFLSHVGKLISGQINHLIYTSQPKPQTA